MLLITYEETLKLLQQEKVVAVPTETVYGLAGLATSTIAVNEIFEIKQRPKNRSLIVHYGERPLWLRDCVWSYDAELLANAFWPGPLSIILPRSLSSLLCAEVSDNTVAIRRPSHQNMMRLCDECGPLAAPSANKYQKLSPTTAEHAQQALSDIPVMLDLTVEHKVGIESTIIDLTTTPYNICRLGSIPIEALQKLVHCTCNSGNNTPGSGRHYQPSKPIRLNALTIATEEALLSFGMHNLHAQWEENLSATENLTEAAANFYSKLWRLSNTDCKQIAVMPIPDHGVGKALNDKLLKAVM